LLGKHKALRSSSSITNKRKKEEGRKEGKKKKTGKVNRLAQRITIYGSRKYQKCTSLRTQDAS
jgi:hypothetical protein